jgi:cell wall assembly regulator SMI1
MDSFGSTAMKNQENDLLGIWQRIESVLNNHVPETASTLSPPATDDQIRELEIAIGLMLPDDFRNSLKVHNGQIDPGKLHSFTYEGVFLDTKGIADTWKMLTDLDEGFRQRETNWDTHGHVEWWNRHWIPYTDANGDSLCINMNPTAERRGEIVCFVHDNPHEPGIAPSFGQWLETLASRLENHEFKVNEYGRLELEIPG